MEEIVALEQPFLHDQQPKTDGIPKQSQIFSGHLAMASIWQIGNIFDIAEFSYATNTEQHQPVTVSGIGVQEDATN